MSHTLTLIGLYILTTVAMAAPPAQGDTAQGRALAETHCAACHGLDGNATASPEFPKIGGLQFEYIAYELKEYRENRRISAIMQPLAAPLTDTQITNLAAHFAAQTPTSGTATRPDLLALGKRLYFEGNSVSGVPSCDGCHEEDGHGSARFPRIAGQNPLYIIDEFKRYVLGQRKFGKKVMRTVAERLTEQEVRAIAEFTATLK